MWYTEHAVCRTCVTHAYTTCLPPGPLVTFFLSQSYHVHMATQEAQKKPRKDCKYNTQERKVIEPFKKDYQSQTTRDGRLLMLKTQILPAMFNYWVSVGKDPQDQDGREQRARVCLMLYRDK